MDRETVGNREHAEDAAADHEHHRTIGVNDRRAKREVEGQFHGNAHWPAQAHGGDECHADAHLALQAFGRRCVRVQQQEERKYAAAQQEAVVVLQTRVAVVQTQR